MNKILCIACAVMLSPVTAGWSLDFDQNISMPAVMEEMKSTNFNLPVPEAKPVEKVIHYPPPARPIPGKVKTYSSVRVYKSSAAMEAALEMVLYQISGLESAQVVSYKTIKLAANKFSFQVFFRSVRKLEVYTVLDANEETVDMLLDVMVFDGYHRIDAQAFKLEHNDIWCCAIVWLIENPPIYLIPR